MKSRHIVFLTITIVFGLLLIGAGFFASILVRQQLTENFLNEYSAQEATDAKQLAESIRIEIEQVQARLYLIAELPEVMSGDTASCTNKLKEIVANPASKVGNLGRVGADGKFHCSVNEKLIGVQANTLGKYMDVIFEDPDHKPVMSRAIKPVGAPSYLVAIHVPVYNKNKEFIGTLGGAVYLNDIEKQYFSNVPFSGKGYITLTDDDGTLLFHYRPELIGLNIQSSEFQKFVVGGAQPAKTIEDIKNGISGTRRYFFDNDEKFAAFEPVRVFPGRNWRIAIVVPTSAVSEALTATGVNRLLTDLPIILSIIIIVLLGVFMWSIGRNVLRPMEELDKVKSEFVGVASHELRTPLGIIKWYTEIIREHDLIHKDPEKAVEYVEEIEKSNERLLTMVRNLLTIARIEEKRAKVTPQDVEVGEVIKDVVKEMKIEADKKQITLALTLPQPSVPKAKIDPTRFRESIENLLSNAIKYSHEKTTVEVLLKESPEGLQFSVKDTGIGIPESAKANMFRRFYRADNVTKISTQGNGLGLHVVKSYVEDWGGKIWYDSLENQGSTFYITLPHSIIIKA